MPLDHLFAAIVLHYIKPHVNYYYYSENQYPFFTLKSSVKNSLSVLVLVLVNCLSINVRKPRVSTDWIDNWDLFVKELRTNFGPYDEVGDVERELVNLHMKDNQRMSEYLVRFNSLSSQSQWGEQALKHHFYNGLPSRLKDEITKGKGKPWTLSEMRQKARNADARYWEHIQEQTQEQAYKQPQQKTQQQPVASSSSSS